MTGSVWFYKLETEKTEPNPNKKKSSQTRKKPSPIGFSLKNRTETGQFELVSVQFWFF